MERFIKTLCLGSLFILYTPLMSTGISLMIGGFSVLFGLSDMMLVSNAYDEYGIISIVVLLIGSFIITVSGILGMTICIGIRRLVVDGESVGKTGKMLRVLIGYGLWTVMCCGALIFTIWR